MDTYYKPTANLNQHDTVQIVKIGQEEQGTFGPQRQCEVVVNGSAMKWTMSQAKYNQLLESGFKEGDIVLLEKWRDGVKKGYNFKSVVKNPYQQPSQSQPSPPPPTQQYVEEEKPNNVQKRIIKGMCFNNACILLKNTNEFDASNAKMVLNLAQELYKEMNPWLNE